MQHLLNLFSPSSARNGKQSPYSLWRGGKSKRLSSHLSLSSSMSTAALVGGRSWNTLDWYQSVWIFDIGGIFPPLIITYPSPRANLSPKPVKTNASARGDCRAELCKSYLFILLCLQQPLPPHSLHADMQNRSVKLTARRDSQYDFDDDVLRVLRILSLSFYHHICSGSRHWSWRGHLQSVPSQVTHSWYVETSTLPRALPSDSVKKIYIHLNVQSPVSSSEVALK